MKDNEAKNYSYYTLTIVNPWLIFIRVLLRLLYFFVLKPYTYFIGNLETLKSLYHNPAMAEKKRPPFYMLPL